MLLESDNAVATLPNPLASVRKRRAVAHGIRRTLKISGFRKFLALIAQLLLISLLIKRYNLESPAFFQLTVLAFGGFAVHYFLPMAFRLAFFLGLSIAGIVMVLGVTQAAWLLGIGVALIGICHTPAPFWAR